jgi:hypothetical protein
MSDQDTDPTPTTTHLQPDGTVFPPVTPDPPDPPGYVSPLEHEPAPDEQAETEAGSPAEPTD